MKKNYIKVIFVKIRKFMIKRYLRYKFFGLKYICPFCKGHYRKFFPAGFNFPVLREKEIIGAGYRENVRCPFCNSSDRERLIFLYIKNETNFLSRPINILHVAPEKNLQKILRSKFTRTYVSIDLISPLADLNMDVTALKFSDNYFDLIICSHVLEHIENDKMAMEEIYRVLKPGGLAILQVPISLKLEESYENSLIIDENEREREFGQKDHVRIYGLDYVKRLNDCGFKVEEFSFLDKHGNKFVNKYALLKNEKIFACRK